MSNSKQQGVVALFIVIFTTLLLTVLVVGFLRIMIQEQKQATNQDLSQSAYDSAVSGVEDAKRVLRACALGDALTCNKLNEVPKKCNIVSYSGIVSSVAPDSSETIINSDGTTKDLNQGYTCVLVDRQSNDYIGNLVEGDSQIIALKAGGADGIRKITIEWMHKDNGAGGTGFAGGDPDHIVEPTVAPMGITSLPLKSGWNPKSPAMLRVQSVLPPAANSVSSTDLDTAVAATTFLRPSSISGSGNNTLVMLPSTRAVNAASPVAVTPVGVVCSDTDYVNGDYACRATLQVSASTNGGVIPLGSNVAFLRLSSLYRNTSYRVTLEGNAGALKFDGVQPTVDSTGRAGNIYRRVSSRLDMSSFIIPPAMVDITGSICKDFYVTDNTSPAISIGSCGTSF